MTDKIQYQPPLLHDAIKLLHASPDPYLFSNSVYSPYQNRCAFQSPTFLTMQSPEFQESYHPFDNVDLNMMMSEKSVGPINYNQLIVRHTKKQQDGFKMFRLETDLMTPIKKKTVSGFVDNQKERIAPIIYQKSSENQQRSSKGCLRNLSIKVKEIVMEMKHTTYKDVAERLIKELIYEAKIEDGENTKDEQNIKRRVYDALNVMIASGILRKEGKRVSADYHAQGSKKAKKGQLDTFQQQLVLYKTQMIFKRNKVLDLFSKYVALSNLTERNKKQKLEDQVPLMFPLLVYWAKEKEVDVHRERNVVTLASKKIVEPIWDCEVILALNFHRKQLTPIRGIPKELICYFQERIGDQYKSIIEGQLQFEFSGLQKQVQKVIPRKIEQDVKVEENSQDNERNQSQNTTAEKPQTGPMFTQEMIKQMPSPKFSQLAQMEYGIPLKQDLEQTQSKQSLNTR